MHVDQDDAIVCPTCNSTRSRDITLPPTDETVERVAPRPAPERRILPEPQGLEVPLVFGKSFKVTFVTSLVVGVIVGCLSINRADSFGQMIYSFGVCPFMAAFCFALFVNLVVIIGRVAFGAIRLNPAERLPADPTFTNVLAKSRRRPEGNTNERNEQIQADGGSRSTDLQPDDEDGLT
jgi:hypothetical protein